MKSQTILLVMCMVCFQGAWSQNWSKISYKEFLKEYSGLLQKQPKQWYQTTIRTSVFADVKATTAEKTEEAVLKVFEGNDYFYGSDAVFQLQQNQRRLDVDTSAKRVLLSDGINANMLGYQPNQFDGIDSSGYRFYTAVSGNRRLLKVEEQFPISSMSSVVFEFDKTKSELRGVKMTYWASNYVLQDLSDQSLEQPVVQLEYSEFKTLASDEVLEATFTKWISESSTTGKLTCPQHTYLLHDLRHRHEN